MASDVSLGRAQHRRRRCAGAWFPPATAQRYGPEVENVSTALAQWATDHFPAVTARDAVAVAVVLTAVALAWPALLVWRLRWAHDGALLVPMVFAGGHDRAAGRRAIARCAGWARARSSPTAPRGRRWSPRYWPPRPFRRVAPRRAARLSGRRWSRARASGAGRFTGRYWTAAAAVITASVRGDRRGAVRMYLDGTGSRIAVVVLVGVLVCRMSAAHDRAAAGEGAAPDLRLDHRP